MLLSRHTIRGRDRIQEAPGHQGGPVGLAVTTGLAFFLAPGGAIGPGSLLPWLLLCPLQCLRHVGPQLLSRGPLWFGELLQGSVGFAC
jgi:hypothetical protein